MPSLIQGKVRGAQLFKILSSIQVRNVVIQMEPPDWLWEQVRAWVLLPDSETSQPLIGKLRELG